MAEEQDPASKTEEPTSKKLEDAHKKGNVARSMEINHWFLILGGVIGLILMSGSIADSLKSSLGRFLASPDLMPADAQGLTQVLLNLTMEVLLGFTPLLVLLVVLAAAANLVQNRPGVAWTKIKPDFSKISPLQGMKRLFSMRSMVDFLKSLAKVGIVTAVGIAAIRPELNSLPDLISSDPSVLPERMVDLTILLFVSVLAVMTVLAAGDYLYQRVSHMNQLKMTRHEVKDEMRQAEGDPLIRTRLRGLRMERARKRMMAAVPTADVVVTNPTHYAVALRYDAEKDAAPKVVAKGQDLIAATIREVAEKHRVPIVQNPPLARALYEVELDRQVPVEHFKAVAEVIGYVMRLKGKLKPRPAAAGAQRRP